MPTHNQPDREHSTPLRRATSADAPAADSAAEAHPLLALQRQLGNAQIARMLAQRESTPEEDDDLLQATHDPAVAQRESTPEEDEELLQAKHDPAIAQRESSPEEDEELLQAKPEVGLEGGPVSDEIAGRIQAQRGSGSPLADGVRTSMEASFGTSFEDVRVHTDSESQDLNTSISARAFTTGNDIFLGNGASSGDSNLMAHELTHVVQQRDMTTSGPMAVGPAGDSYEQQADATAATVAAGGAAPTAQRKHEE